MKNRYYELKNFYKNYIIFIKIKNKYITYDIDKEIFEYLNCKRLKYFKKYNINYIILDNLDIMDIVEFDNNRYIEYYLKSRLYKIIEWGIKI